MPFIPRDPRQYRPGNPGQEWLNQLRSGGRITASLPLLEATGAFTDRIGPPGQSMNWRDRQATGQRARAASGSYLDEPGAMPRGAVSAPQPPTASERIPAVRSAIASLRPGGTVPGDGAPGGQAVSPNPLTPGGYQSIQSAASWNQSAPLDKSDVGDGGGFFSGVGDYLGAPGMSNALLGAGGAMMEAAGKPGATFGGSLGSGIKGFATERARYGASESARQRTAETATAGVRGWQDAIRRIGTQEGVDPVRLAEYVAMATSKDGYDYALSQIAPDAVDPVQDTAPARNIADMQAARATVERLIAAGVDVDDPEMIVARQAVNDWELQMGIRELPSQDPGMTDYRFRLDGLARAAGFPGGTEQLMKDDPKQFVQLSREATGDRQGDVYENQWMSPAQLANDTALGALERAYYIGGGRGLQMQNLATFDEVVGLIQGQIDRDRRNKVDVGSEEYLNSSSRQGNSLMGWVVGNMPFAASMLNPEDANALDLVRAVVFQSLKETLGGQFAEREGERLVAAAYNPMLSPEVNMRRILRLRNNMVQSERWYEALRDYKREHGHLADFDYDSAIEYYVDNPVTIGAHLQVSDYEGVTDVPGAVATDIERLVKAERDFGNDPMESLSQVRARLFARFDPEQVASQGPALLNSVERSLYDAVEDYLRRGRR